MEDILVEIGKQTPMVGLMIWLLLHYIKQIKLKDRQILDLAEKSIKAISVYQVHIANVDNVQKENSKEHQELAELLRAILTILTDLKEGRIKYE